jgi:NAD(P)-dependent dehydrogenase (short-subunit alcohol dehydrogenase family)
MSDELDASAGRKSFLSRFILAGKVVLITGGSRGIGRSIALGLAEAGADIVLAARKLPDLEEAAHEITCLGRRALAVPANVRHVPELNNLVARAVAEFGRIDILVNNAATNPVFGSVLDVDEKAWDVTMGLNLKSCFFLSQAVGRVMRERGGGNVINIASEDGVRPFVGLGVYSISKAGVIMLTRVLAQEWGQYHIRVNAIAPAFVRTRFSQAVWGSPQMASEVESNTALGRIAEPEEMVDAALFLASEASSYITGQTIVLDGGHFASVRPFLSMMAPVTRKEE